MIDFKSIRTLVAKGLEAYLGCEVIRSNQTGKPPEYPYASYTLTTPASADGGTWGDYGDGTKRKPVTQTWSITIQSDDTDEATSLALQARNWFEEAGKLYLNDNNIIVQRVGNIANRDNLITIEYEYRCGFDVVFYFLDEVGDSVTEFIETVDLGGVKVEPRPSEEELNEKLQKRLTGR